MLKLNVPLHLLFDSDFDWLIVLVWLIALFIFDIITNFLKV